MIPRLEHNRAGYSDRQNLFACADTKLDQCYNACMQVSAAYFLVTELGRFHRVYRHILHLDGAFSGTRCILRALLLWGVLDVGGSSRLLRQILGLSSCQLAGDNQVEGSCCLLGCLCKLLLIWLLKVALKHRTAVIQPCARR